MENWITVATFTYPTELSLVKSYLEAEEIEFNVKDELAVQADNFLSNAIGGVKLQVKPKDVERVKAIVIDFGHTPESDIKPSRFWTSFDAFTASLPFIKNLRIELRLIFISTVVLLSIVSTLVLFLKPTLKEELIDNKWCLNYVEYNGKKYTPSTLGLVIKGFYNCDENIDFTKPDHVLLPGFETKQVYAYWDLVDDKIIISDPSELGSVYAGEYAVNKSFGEMILTSETTILYCSKATFHGGYYLP